MKCDLCEKKATVHLTEIIDEQMTELHLCEECARDKSVQMEQQFGLADLLAGLADFGKQVKSVEKEISQCDSCGMTYDDFRKFGRLGCSECYAAFGAQLSTLLKKIHGSNIHLGKTPLSLAKAAKKGRKKTVDALSDLKLKLQKTIAEEDFEKAAEIRDKIRALEQKERKKA